MLKNFDIEIKEADGSIYLEPFLTGERNETGLLVEKNEDGTLKMVPVKYSTVLSGLLKNGLKEETLNADEYIERWELMKAMAKGGDIEIDGKMKDKLRNIVVKGKLPHFIAGQICAYLNEP